LRQGVIRLLRRLGFGCGHVFVQGQATKMQLLTRYRPEYHQSAYFKGAATTLNIAIRRVRGMWSPSTRV
jgi:hypothetical protein